MPTSEKTIGVTEFKRKCLGLVDDVASGLTSRVILTKRGKPVAAVVKLENTDTDSIPDPWGAMRGMLNLDPSIDLTAPIGSEFDWGTDPVVRRDE